MVSKFKYSLTINRRVIMSERKYRIHFKFSVKDAYITSVWFETVESATSFINTLVRKIEFSPEYMRIKIEEKIV